MALYDKTVYRNPAQVYLSSLDSGVSLKNCTSVLNNVCKKMGYSGFMDYPWLRFDYVELLKLKRLLIDSDVLPKTVNHYLMIVKCVCREAWRLRTMTTDTYMRIKDVKRVKGHSTPTGRALNQSELKKLINYQPDTNNPIDIRDSAIIAAAYGAGLRRSELTLLDSDSYVGNKILVHGKGNVQSFVYLPDFAKNAIDRWLRLKPIETAPLFTHVHASGFISDKRLATRTIGDIIKRRQVNAGITHFTPHDLRRSFATNLIDSGIDLFTVQKLMRHADIGTTRTYDMRHEQIQIDAIKMLPF